MKARGLKVDKAWIRPGDFTFESGHKAATALLALDARPTAIFASSDEMALGALAAAAEADLSARRHLGGRLRRQPCLAPQPPAADHHPPAAGGDVDPGDQDADQRRGPQSEAGARRATNSCPSP
jgi:hypothetical protein